MLDLELLNHSAPSRSATLRRHHDHCQRHLFVYCFVYCETFTLLKSAHLQRRLTAAHDYLRAGRFRCGSNRQTGGYAGSHAGAVVYVFRGSQQPTAGTTSHKVYIASCPPKNQPTWVISIVPQPFSRRAVQSGSGTLDTVEGVKAPTKRLVLFRINKFIF